MAELTNYKDAASNRHSRFKLQSSSRRLDELEEATKNLQRAEDELSDLQDKVIQAEGSDSSTSAEIEVSRQRVSKIEGKDEEIKRAEDLCHTMKEKLEEEENLTRELKSEIERLQKRMVDLEKLEEALSRSKNECSQLCLSLNEERNSTKKISSELEMLRVKVKELESSEDRLDKTEQSLVSELEKLKSLTSSFVNERKYLNEKEKENEKIIKELTQKSEQNKKMNRDHMRNASTFSERNDLRIEDGISSTSSSKESKRKGSLDYLKQVENETRDKSENEKNRNQEDNKVKDLNQEIEKLKTQIKHFESLEEELKKMRAKNNDLQDNYLTESNRNRSLASQLEEIKSQVRKQKELGNGDIEGEDAFLLGRGRHERTKLKGHGSEASVSKHTSRESSPQHKRERLRNREFALSNEHYSLSSKQASSPVFTNKRAAKASNMGMGTDSGTQETKRTEDRFAPGSSHSEGKRGREQPSVLSRYPPAAQEHTKVWKGAPKPGTESGLKGKVEKTTRTFSDSTHVSVPNDIVGKGDKTSDLSSEAHCGKRGQVPGHASQGTQAVESSCSKAIGALSSSQKASSEGLSKGKKTANGLAADANFSNSKAPILSKYPYSSRSQENILQGFSLPNKEGVDQPVAVVMEDSSQHEASRCRVIKSSGREKPDSDDDSDIESFVTAKLVNTTITPEPEPKPQPNSREKVKSRGGTRTALFENDKNAAIENDSVKPTRPSSNAIEFPDANCAGVKNQRPFSPREASRSRAIIKPVIIDKDVKKIMGGSGTEVVLEKQKSTSKSVTSKVTSSITIYPSDSSGPRAVPSEAPRERHTSTSNIQVGPPELTAISNHVSSPLELSIHKHDITLQLTEAERVGDGSPKNRAEMVVSRSSILIKPSESVEKNSHVPPAETIRWKSHSASSEVASSDSRHITVRNAWKSKRDPPTRIGRNMEATNAYTQRSPTDFLELEQPRSHPSEQGARKVGSSGDAPERSSRRTQSSLTASEVLTRRDRMGGAITAASWNHSSSMEEGEDSTFVTSRRIHNPSEHSESPGKQGSPEPEPVWTEERSHPAKPYAEED